MYPVRDRKAVEHRSVGTDPGNTAALRWMWRAALSSAAVLVLASCSEPQPPPPQSQTTVRTEPGVAGGVVDETHTATATITAIDPSSRRVTLTDPDGDTFAFTAGPEIRNFAQMRVGDKVTATFTRRISIDVRSDGAPPSASYSTENARAALGNKPGAVTAEDTTVVGRVTAIDPANRTATIQFPDGSTRTVPVRQDVDLSRYKVGDSVVTRVRSRLTVLVTSP
jgi:Cu/Ag efflux protein CusF